MLRKSSFHRIEVRVLCQLAVMNNTEPSALAERGLEILAIAPSLRVAEAELAQMPSPVARFAAAAAEEVNRSDGLDSEGIKGRKPRHFVAGVPR